MICYVVLYHVNKIRWTQLKVHMETTGHVNSSPKMAAILADDIFKCIFLNENDWIPTRISLKFVPRSPIDNRPALV